MAAAVMSRLLAVAECPNTEQELVERARTAASDAAFVVGECAAEWVERYANGRTDEDFAVLIGSTRTTVNNRRLVHERFCQTFGKFSDLRWSHYAVAMNWPDADNCLDWADANRATVAEMKAWRRMQNGEDLTIDSEADLPADDEAELVAPMSAALPATSAELGTETVERATEPAAEAITPGQFRLAQITDEQCRQLRRLLNAITRSVKKTQELGERFEPIVLEHIDRLADDLKRGEDIAGLDESTVEGMLRGDS